jgi:hypothetical protein
VDDWASINVIDGSHDAVLEFLFGNHADVAQNGAGELGEETHDQIEPGAVLGRKGELGAALGLGGEPSFARTEPECLPQKEIFENEITLASGKGPGASLASEFSFRCCLRAGFGPNNLIECVTVRAIRMYPWPRHDSPRPFVPANPQRSKISSLAILTC